MLRRTTSPIAADKKAKLLWAGCNSQKLLFDGITGFNRISKIKLILLSCQKTMLFNFQPTFRNCSLMGKAIVLKI
jgi:hypothetical protein